MGRAKYIAGKSKRNRFVRKIFNACRIHFCLLYQCARFDLKRNRKPCFSFDYSCGHNCFCRNFCFEIIGVSFCKILGKEKIKKTKHLCAGWAWLFKQRFGWLPFFFLPTMQALSSLRLSRGLGWGNCPGICGARGVEGYFLLFQHRI